MTLVEAVALVRAYLAGPPAPGPLSELSRRETVLSMLWEGLPPACWRGLLLELGATRRPSTGGGSSTVSTTEPPCESLRKWLTWRRGAPLPPQLERQGKIRKMRLTNWRSA